MKDTQEGETVIDLAPSPVPVRTRIPVPAQPPPWFEWSDDVINEETWDIDTPEYDYFEDTFSIAELLRSKAYRWMRPSDVFPSPPSVVRFKTRVLDLISPNAHLFEKSEAMRYILSEISELYEYGLQNKFECEGEGVAYVPNYADDEKRWTPWSHIYSCCKAGVKGEIPVYNPKGKYYVRLYFMGSWRRIMVDDRIPVLHSGLTALPLTSLNELWPLILTKALLKVAMATFEGNDVKRFSTTSALTGWVFEWVDNIEGMPEEDLWNDLEGLLPKFRHPSRIPSAYNMTAPQLAREKKSKTEAAAGETFWWMPALTSPPTDLNDVAFKDFEREPLKQVENIVTESSEAATYVEYIWKNKADLLLNKYYRND
ncbi:Androglobin, partial [Orchesella cincta]